MPTSSQARILIHEVDRISLTAPDGCTESSATDVAQRQMAPYAVASVYNIYGRMILSNNRIKDYDPLRVIGRASAELFKYHQLPEGYQCIVSFDPVAHSFGWKILGDDNKKADDDEQVEIDTKQDTVPGTDVHRNMHRPAASFTFHNSSYLHHHLDKGMYERLIQLGFRKSVQELRPEEADAAEDSTKPTHVQRDPRFQEVITSMREIAATDSVIRLPGHCRVCVSAHGILLNETHDEDASLENIENYDIEEDEEFYRIKPSIYMRKDKPIERPMSAIFSLRDNEEYAHVDVKYMIEKQIGVKVKSLQFDPLNVRTSKQDIRSRWILDVESKTELDKVVSKGLVLGRDKIIIFRFDDIAKREVSSFKYYKSIVDARKRLKGTSQSKLNVKNKLRTTKSEATHRRQK